MDESQDPNQLQEGRIEADAGRKDGTSPLTEQDETAHFKAGDYLQELIDQAPRAPRPRRKTDTIMIPNAGRMITSLLPRQAGADEERKAGYRLWLESKNKEDLIGLILGLDQEGAGIEATRHLMDIYEAETSGGVTYSALGEVAYTRLPIARGGPEGEHSPTWRVVLVGLDQNSRPLGLLIDGEITVGRAVGEAVPDLDLTPFGAKTKGVSRIHARLRPSEHGLMLVDSDSSNGTYQNRRRIPTQTEQPIKEGDVITFGRANFLVRMLRPPVSGETRTLF